jgi:hypothetical protein
MTYRCLESCLIALSQIQSVVVPAEVVIVAISSIAD